MRWNAQENLHEHCALSVWKDERLQKLVNEKSLFYQTVVFVESMKERSSGWDIMHYDMLCYKHCKPFKNYKYNHVSICQCPLRPIAIFWICPRISTFFQQKAPFYIAAWKCLLLSGVNGNICWIKVFLMIKGVNFSPCYATISPNYIHPITIFKIRPRKNFFSERLPFVLLSWYLC